ncbi:MAG: hypothetical protein ACK5Q9_08700 [Cyclobacteriaceae bacterium]|jgi:hypothetical protein
MTKRDFFILLIKLFGLFFLIKSLFLITLVLRQPNVLALISFFIGLAVVAGLFWLLIFKADKVVALLRLESGLSDERIELGNIRTGDIIKIGTFVIGGLLIIDNIPQFLHHSYWFVRGNNSEQDFNSSDNYDLVVSGLNILLGYLLATNYAFVSRIINVKKDSE